MRCNHARTLVLFAALFGSFALAWQAAPAAASQAAGEDEVAGFESAGKLLRKCRESSSYARSFCFAYLAAVADSARSYRIWLGAGDPCLPADLSLGRLADIFDAHLVNNPSLTEAQAASVVVASLQAAFPCPAVQPGQSAAPSEHSAQAEIDAGPQQDRNPHPQDDPHR